MSRDLTAAVQSAIEATQVQPFLLFEGLFDSGYLRLWSGQGDIVWDGKTWVGSTGLLFSVSGIQDSADIQANGVSVTINGIPSNLISLALGECKQGASGKVYIGFLEDFVVVSTPVLLFEGKLDVPAIQEDGESSTITISYESRLIQLQRPKETRYTNEEQQRLFAGDLGCEFVPAMKEITLTWGRS